MPETLEQLRALIEERLEVAARRTVRVTTNRDLLCSPWSDDCVVAWKTAHDLVARTVTL